MFSAGFWIWIFGLKNESLLLVFHLPAAVSAFGSLCCKPHRVVTKSLYYPLLSSLTSVPKKKKKKNVKIVISPYKLHLGCSNVLPGWILLPLVRARLIVSCCLFATVALCWWGGGLNHSCHITIRSQCGQ